MSFNTMHSKQPNDSFRKDLDNLDDNKIQYNIKENLEKKNTSERPDGSARLRSLGEISKGVFVRKI